MKILVNQENSDNLKYIYKGLKECGYLVNSLVDIEDMLNTDYLLDYDLIILDVKTKKQDIFYILELIRTKLNNIGIIVVTSVENIEMKIKLLENGVDDYIIRPFDFRELIARIKALKRRLTNVKELKDEIVIGDLKINLLTREAKRGNKEIYLSTKEFELLRYFIVNKNIVLTRTMIKEMVWGIDFLSETNIIDVYINHLRKKIDGDFEGKFFHTIRGVGYIFKC